jgi:hypothetical protein
MRFSSPPYALHAPPISFFSILLLKLYWVKSTVHSAPRHINSVLRCIIRLVQKINRMKALQRGETVIQLPSPKCGLRCNAAPFHSYV